MPRGIDRYNEAQLQGRLWTPQELRNTGNLKVWLEAIDFTGATATGVSQWNDRSGNGLHAVQSNGPSQPPLQSSGLNGRPTLNFDSTGVLVITLSITTDTLGAFVVGSLNAGSASYGRLLSMSSAPLAADFNSSLFADVLSRDATTQAVLAYRNSAALASRAISAYDKIFLASSVFDGSNQTTGIDGDYSSFPSAGAFGIGTCYIGSHTSHAPDYFIGKISAVILTTGALSLRQKYSTEGYLSWRYGTRLAASHSYANRPPLIGD